MSEFKFTLPVRGGGSASLDKEKAIKQCIRITPDKYETIAAGSYIVIEATDDSIKAGFFDRFFDDPISGYRSILFNLSKRGRYKYPQQIKTDEIANLYKKIDPNSRYEILLLGEELTKLKREVAALSGGRHIVPTSSPSPSPS